MVDCLCVWLYCTLGFEQLSKATVLLERKIELRVCVCQTLYIVERLKTLMQVCKA